jgi:hypothetical protein
MAFDISLNDKEIVEEILRTRQPGVPTISEARVRELMSRIGAEIERSGELRKEAVEQLLKQLNDGTF